MSIKKVDATHYTLSICSEFIDKINITIKNEGLEIEGELIPWHYLDWGRDELKAEQVRIWY